MLLQILRCADGRYSGEGSIVIETQTHIALGSGLVNDLVLLSVP